MNFFKEYDDSQSKMHCWLPWACQISAGVVANKDGSFIGAFSYTNVKKGTYKYLQVFFCKLPCGWNWWSERRSTAGVAKNYIAVSWMPRRKNGRIVNIPEMEGLEDLAEEQIFQKVIEGLRFCGFSWIQQLTGVALLQYLHDTVTPDSEKINKPPLPLYLDVLLSQKNYYEVNCQRVKINEQFLQAISVAGIPDLLPLLEFLDAEQIAYRFVRRFLCFDKKAAQKEMERYMKGWCAGRKSILPALAYEFHPDKVCGYLRNTLLLWNRESDKLAEICTLVRGQLDSAGQVSILEKYNLADVWMGTIPGMFRSNIAPPLVELDSVEALVV